MDKKFKFGDFVLKNNTLSIGVVTNADETHSYVAWPSGNSAWYENRELEIVKNQLIENIELWFKTAKPTPTIEDMSVQIGCHIEEITEMFEAITGREDSTEFMSKRAETFKDKQPLKMRLIKAISENPGRRAGLLDALCDQIVTAIGVGYMMGFDMAAAIDEVNRSNWSKFEGGKPVFDKNGKIAKGRDYFKPDLDKFLG